MVVVFDLVLFLINDRLRLNHTIHKSKLCSFKIIPVTYQHHYTHTINNKHYVVQFSKNFSQKSSGFINKTNGTNYGIFWQMMIQQREKHAKILHSYLSLKISFKLYFTLNIHEFT